MAPILKGGEFNGPVIVEHYWNAFRIEYRRVMLDRMLLMDADPKEDDAIIQSLLDWMFNTEADFPRTFAGIERAAQAWTKQKDPDSQISESELNSVLAWAVVEDLKDEEKQEIRLWLHQYKKRERLEAPAPSCRIDAWVLGKEHV